VKNENYYNYFKGLTALVETSFPRKCSCCGKVYPTAKQFLTETHQMPNGRSSLKSAQKEDGTPIVEVFRNCVCGSTLMDEFNCRRDESSQGMKRRAQFDELLTQLQNENIPVDKAHEEILKVFYGKHSEILDFFLKKEN